MTSIQCEVCQSRYASGSETRTWRNAAREVFACEVCGNLLADWAGKPVVPRFTLLWRGARPLCPPAHPAFRSPATAPPTSTPRGPPRHGTTGPAPSRSRRKPRWSARFPCLWYGGDSRPATYAQLLLALPSA
jgi:hypothetical protein